MKQPLSVTNDVFFSTKRFKQAVFVLVWSGIIALALFYITQNALRFYSLKPELYKAHWHHAGFLLLHISGGILALLLGPSQFWSGLRRKHLQFHRWMGRVYLMSIGVSSTSAFYILLLPESSLGFRLGIAGLAFCWLCTTGLAYLAIRRREIGQHREWMVRSYVVTFGFVFFRLMLDGMNAFEIGTIQERISAVSWLCWALPLFITEIILQGRKILKIPEKRRSL